MAIKYINKISFNSLTLPIKITDTNLNILMLVFSFRLILSRAFNIFQVYQYFTIYRWYLLLKFEHLHVYLMQYSLNLGGIKYHFERVKVPGTAPY